MQHPGPHHAVVGSVSQSAAEPKRARKQGKARPQLRRAGLSASRPRRKNMHDSASDNDSAVALRAEVSVEAARFECRRGIVVGFCYVSVN